MLKNKALPLLFEEYNTFYYLKKNLCEKKMKYNILPSVDGNLESRTKGKKVIPPMKGIRTSGTRTPSAS